MAIELNVYRAQQEFTGKPHDLETKICADCEAFWRDNGAWFDIFPQTPADTTHGVCNICGAGGDDEDEWEDEAPSFTTLRDAEQYASGKIDTSDYTDEEGEALEAAAAQWLWDEFSELEDDAAARKRAWTFYRRYSEEWQAAIRVRAGIEE